MSEKPDGPGPFTSGYLGDLRQVVGDLPQVDLVRVLDCLADAHNNRRQVFVAGNGGSSSAASHLVNDLMLGVAKKGKRGFRAIALADNTAVITAIANDDGYDQIFEQPLRALAEGDDVLIVISASGNSPNVLRALEAARQLSLKTIGLLGMDGGRAREMVDVPVVVPSRDYGHIETVHAAIGHLVAAFFRG